jgi:uncharacterized protein
VSVRIRLAGDLALPVDEITGTRAILGIRGSGKTNVAVVFAEEIIKAGHPVCIVDPLDVWWGLRSSRAGNSAGLPVYIFGGPHAHAPLEAAAGVVMARFIVENRVPTILSLKHLRNAEQARFMTDFAEELRRLNHEPLPVIIDEAARFVPQNLTGRPEIARCVGAVQDLGAEGRAFGIGVTLIGQRASRIHKDVLTQCETIVAMRTLSPQDRRAIDEWVEAHGTREQRDVMMAEIASLPTGTGYYWSPMAGIFKRVAFRARETFDSSATPKVGTRISQPRAFAEIDLERLRGDIASAIKRAKDADPKSLHAKIAELERALQNAGQQRSVPEIKYIEVPALSASQVDQLLDVARALGRAAEEASVIGKAIVEAVVGAKAAAGVPARTSAARVTLRRQGHAPSSRPVKTPRENGRAVEGGAVTLRAGERRMLQVLAQFAPRRLSRSQLGALSGFSPGGGTFSTYLGTLKRAGLVEIGRDVTITEPGVAFLDGDFSPAPRSEQDLVAVWRSALRAGENRMLDELLQVYPETLSRSDLGDRSGFAASGGTFSTYLGTLRRNGLVEVHGSEVRAAVLDMLEQRPVRELAG